VVHVGVEELVAQRIGERAAHGRLPEPETPMTMITVGRIALGP
jgi:hypothetical protein